jgi:hypothetical protein
MFSGYTTLNEAKNAEPYTPDSPIVLKSIGCEANYDKEIKTITIKTPNSDEFICSAQSFKWVEGYPQSIALTYAKCEQALKHVKNDEIMLALVNLYKMPYSPYFVHLFESDKSMMKDFKYISQKMEGEENKKRLEQFLTSLLEEGKDDLNIKKTDVKFFNMVKNSLENLILYLKSKCEVFLWFYQGLPQLTQFGIW